jgi:hypothetical protein
MSMTSFEQKLFYLGLIPAGTVTTGDTNFLRVLDLPDRN